MREIEFIIIHCADTPPDMDIGAAEIRRWHVEERGWRDIGYHQVIRRNGGIEPGRPIDETGAHAKHYNKNSIGVCLVGGKGGPDFTPAQWTALAGLIRDLVNSHPGAGVIGHRDVDPHKQCPTFDARQWWAAVCGGGARRAAS